MPDSIQPSDMPFDEQPVLVKTFKTNTGYPSNLTENQIVRLIYFFGARKLSVKSFRQEGKTDGKSTRPAQFGPMEKEFLKEAFIWFGFVSKTPDQFAAAYRAIILRFKAILAFLKQRPGYITPEIHQALQMGYKSVLRNIVTVMDENRNVALRLASNDSKHPVPIGKIESELWEFQNVLTDKLKMIIESITPADVRRANLGMKSKALRDLYSVMFMTRKDSRNPNQVLVNVNIQGSDAKTKLQVLSAYIAKNRENRG